MAEKVGPIFNRILIKKLDQALDNGSITKKDYKDLKKKYFGKPKLIQMELFDPDKKKQGGLMEATKRLKAQGLKKGGFPDLSGDGKVTMKDVLMGRGVIKKPKKKASGGAVDTPRKKRGNYGPNIGKPFKAMGPVGGVPVNRSGTKIMSKAGRLAKRGYGIAKK